MSLVDVSNKEEEFSAKKQKFEDVSEEEDMEVIAPATRIKKKCSFVENGVQCTNGSVQGGVCRRHGAGTKKCSFVEKGVQCTNGAYKGGVCVKHGAERPRCSFVESDGSRCTNNVQQGGVCAKHGAEIKKCSFEEDGVQCTNQSVNGGVCIRHGAEIKKCSFVENGVRCTNVSHKNGVCRQHGAEGAKCIIVNNEVQCTNLAQKNGLCSKHGAVRIKCSFVENGVQCIKNAQKGGVCIKHGADIKKCSFVENGVQCTNFAQKGGVCVKHGAEIGVKCKYNSETMCGIKIGSANRYDGACVRCFVQYNPNDPRAVEANKWAKVKEQSVVDFVKSEFPTISWTCDRQIRSAFNDNFARVRPDMRALMKSIDVDTHDLIVEADEWRHEAEPYGGCKGENERIGAVWRNISGGKRPLIVVRINPDDYIDPSTGKIVTSCFAYSKARGKVGVKPSKETEWGARLEKLRQTISYWTIEGNVPDKELTTIQLFY